MSPYTIPMETTAKESPPQIPIPIFEDFAGIHAASLNKDKAAQSVAWKRFEQNLNESESRPKKDHWESALKKLNTDSEDQRSESTRALDSQLADLFKLRRSWFYRVGRCVRNLFHL